MSTDQSESTHGQELLSRIEKLEARADEQAKFWQDCIKVLGDHARHIESLIEASANHDKALILIAYSLNTIGQVFEQLGAVPGNATTKDVLDSLCALLQGRKASKPSCWARATATRKTNKYLVQRQLISIRDSKTYGSFRQNHPSPVDRSRISRSYKRYR